MNCCSVFPYDFFMIFSKIIFVDFFLNIELVKNYNYNKAKSYGGKPCNFSHKILWIATIFL